MGGEGVTPLTATPESALITAPLNIYQELAKLDALQQSDESAAGSLFASQLSNWSLAILEIPPKV